MKTKKKQLVIGWREWVGLPDLGNVQVKAKVDSGAATSSICADRIKEFEKDGHTYVSFIVYPVQRTLKEAVRCEAKLLTYRKITSSNGKTDLRPIIETRISLFGKVWTSELSLADRHTMGFRMLLGRKALKNRFLVDTGKSFVASKELINETRNSLT